MTAAVTTQSRVQEIKTFADEVSRLRSVVLLSLLYAAGSEVQSTLGKVVCFGLGSALVVAGIAVEAFYLYDGMQKLHRGWQANDMTAVAKASLSVISSLIFLVAKTSILVFSARALMIGCDTSICADVFRASSSQQLFHTENLSVLARI